jgi:hypothetical protein
MTYGGSKVPGASEYWIPNAQDWLVCSQAGAVLLDRASQPAPFKGFALSEVLFLFAFCIVHGDKECFHLAWQLLGPNTQCRARPPDKKQHTIVQHVIEEVTSQRSLYRQVSYGERPMRLESQGEVSEGTAECERRWDVNISDGQAVLP